MGSVEIYKIFINEIEAFVVEHKDAYQSNVFPYKERPSECFRRSF